MISRGSQWKRWEPHIHAPGTVLNNQFKADSWEEYLTALEALTPRLEALAVADYYITDTYEKVLRSKESGRLKDVQLIFPNVELRLDVATKSGFVNIHLLVSPEDSDHIDQLRRILTRLQFQAYGDCFDCTASELIKLGKKIDINITDNLAALRCGATQFKVNFNQLKEVYHKSDWAKKNILVAVAVAGASGDGTSGLRQAADATIRKEIEAFSHIIFSSNAAQREFWLGQRKANVETLRESYNGCKPCLHGSDSHSIDTVGKPVAERYTWIKGDLEFDALRQACIDPEGRAFVGAEPPPSAMPSQVITSATISNASWAQTPEILLNKGLVAIIGARGSGKTALADMIAAGCDSIPEYAWNGSENTSPSFLARARSHIGDASITLNWEGGDESSRALNGQDANGHLSFPRARYLSQQFVEELCSSSGVSDGLVEEIERVILEAHPLDERNGAVSFSEFREHRTSRFQQSRSRETEAISNLSERIAIEIEKERLTATFLAQITQKENLIQGYNADLAKLVVKGTEAQVKRHADLREAAQDVRGKIQVFSNQRRTFISLQDEVASTRATKAPELLRQAQERHGLSGFTSQQWDEFLLIYKGDVDSSLAGYVTWADTQIAELNGHPMPLGDPNVPTIADEFELNTLNLSTITTEMTRLEALFSAVKVVREQYTALTKRLGQENAALKALEEKLLDAQGASTRKNERQIERDEAYKRVFDAIINEQSVLSELYAPLMERLTESIGTLSRLSFYVRRVVDVRKWGAYAEEHLLDRRKAGPFNGKGALTDRAEEMLKPAWEHGTSDEIKGAITNFVQTYLSDILAHAPYEKQQSEYKGWLKSFALWLYGTDHITIRYEILYDETDIRKLSPGTRGIVLLLLYLALDDADDRPLIIDQPEENLDPKSVNDELVPLFIAAKAKRQVIMVTHNANLVINTDADQIIIAEVGAHQAGGLPPITYRAGGLENASIRTAVRDIVEGGESAFQERARRLRVRLER